MSYFNHRKNVDDYIKMANGYDGRELIEVLKGYLPRGSTILELGMGPGKDLDILKQNYVVTGSDVSQVFLDMYREKNPDSDLLLMNAIAMDTDRKFECIYSNKVLIHLGREDLRTSLKNQADVLNDNGLLFHSFWHGDKEETFGELRFVYYTEHTIMKYIGNEYEVLDLKLYNETEEADSFYLILQKK